jgi:hypothetical protein
MSWLATNWLVANLTVAGAILIGLGVLHIALPSVLRWRQEFAGVSMVNRDVGYVHCFFIGLSCLLWGLLPVMAGRSLVAPGPVTRLVLVGAVVFWGSRLLIQLTVFNRHAARSRCWRVLSVAATGMWLYLTASWVWALLAQ